MPLTPGDKLGPYEILSPLGAGGMGEVYKARDTRLDRSVAMKVLPEHIAKREDLRARFEREARAVASLNHPNICTLFDIGEQAGTSYMVMELMEGETLAARIEKGPIPLEQALSYAAQIADALDRAHRAGVTHRDVKPANIMLTRDGVKVLDFGLAKSTAKIGPTDATLVASLTTEGSIIGTPQYMAPEQFEGKEADARADIWAFGALLYEMVTGQKAFQGKSYGSLIGSILSAEPAPMAVASFTPAWLERLVRRCLAKDPEGRYFSMHDIVLDLRTPPVDTAGASAQNSRLPWAIAAACLALSILAGGAWMRKPTEPRLPIKFDVNPPEGSQFDSISNYGGSAISPDGRTLAFVATNARRESLLYVSPLESMEARALPGTEGAGKPFWSPDSKSLGFVAGGKLKRIDVMGGAPITLCDGRFARGGAWSEEGVILFGDQNLGLQRIPASGGSPVMATQLNKESGESSHYYPQFLPDGKQFLYLVRHVETAKMGIYLGALDGRKATRIVSTEYKAIYDSGSGRLLFLQSAGLLMAQKLDLNPPRLTGDPNTLAQKIGVAQNNGYAEFSISNNGALFYGRERGTLKTRFGWRDRAGKLMDTVGQPVWVAGSGFALSPDGKSVAYAGLANSGLFDVWVMELTRGLSTRISFNRGLGPKWQPDGKQIYFGTQRGLHRKAADGSGEEELLVAKDSSVTLSAVAPFGGSPQSVSPDGNYLLVGISDIMLLPLSGERKLEAYLETKYYEGNSRFSPDGRWVAYQSDESGRSEIYVQGFPDRRGKWVVSAEGGTNPEWRADGKELFWLAPGNLLMAAGVELQQSGVRVGQVEPLFRVPYEGRFQPSRDGRRFLVQEPDVEQQQQKPMVVELNWAARLGK